MKDTLCTNGGHSHHQFGVNLVGFHAINFTVQAFVFIIYNNEIHSMYTIYIYYTNSQLRLVSKRLALLAQLNTLINSTICSLNNELTRNNANILSTINSQLKQHSILNMKQ